MMTRPEMVLGLVATIAAALAATSARAQEQADAGTAAENRLGIVVLQFDDGFDGHYTAFQILEKYKLKGSFGVVTGVLGKPGRLTAEQVVEMSKAGHEIHDHTLDHNPGFWGNPQNKEKWKLQIEQSLDILKKLGIRTRGWNQPGGGGCKWTPELHEALRPYYDYVAGRVLLKPEFEDCNIHWNLKDHPFNLGFGGIREMQRKGGKEAARKDVLRAETQIVDSLQQGLVAIPLFHEINEERGTAWELEELCKFLSASKLPVTVMADAVKAIQNPRRFQADVEQMPNPSFACDLDHNDRPDGYANCSYAPAEVKSPAGGRAAQFTEATTTWIHGPQVGRAQLSLTVRSPDGTSRTITPTLTFAEINDKHEYRWREKERCEPIPAGTEWKTTALPVTIDKNVDRVKIEFAVSPAGKVYVGKASWRQAP